MQITDYEPKLVWSHFDKIRVIPRGSGHEERARQYVLDYAAGRNYEADCDETGNVVVRVPGTPGHENAPIVAIQGHLDMVCEKNSNVDHDFSKDPIQLDIQGEWLTAKGTTLGSDNGVGVAAALAVADADNVVHGPLELLFTVDEEVGLTGAGQLRPGCLKAKYLLNLDSEELGAVFIGCAGGGDSTLTLPIDRETPPPGAQARRLHVAGLRGGHSGLDIVEQRGNAIKVLARALWEGKRVFSLRVASIQGGNKRNAIPREADAEIFVSKDQVGDFEAWLSKFAATVSLELGGREKELFVSLEESSSAPAVLVRDAEKRLLDLLLAIPHGVEAMSYDIPGLVETSNNLATISSTEGEIVIGTSSRSSINTALQSVRDRIRSAAELAGAAVEEEAPYPGWKPNLESELLVITTKVHKEIFGKEPRAEAIHAGLECGIIGEKFPGLDMISFGPQIEHPHSPEERIHIASVEKFWALLHGVLEALA